MKKQLKFKKIDFYLIDALFGESWEKNLFFKKNVYLRLMKNKIPIPLFCSHYSGYFQIYCIFCNSIYDILAIPFAFWWYSMFLLIVMCETPQFPVV